MTWVEAQWMLAWTVIYIFQLVLWNERFNRGYISRGILWALRKTRVFGSLPPGAYISYLLIGIVLSTIAHFTIDPLLRNSVPHINDFSFWILSIIKVIDDVLHGGDDRWKRYFAWVKNKIKWRMELPHVSET